MVKENVGIGDLNSEPSMEVKMEKAEARGAVLVVPKEQWKDSTPNKEA